jgi:hypothetical protein
VVVGFDRYINYYKIQYATLCIRENPGCLFIATNRDAVTHLTDAQVSWHHCVACEEYSNHCVGNAAEGSMIDDLTGTVVHCAVVCTGLEDRAGGL